MTPSRSSQDDHPTDSGDDDNMDTSESRKRGRPDDSILGDDVPDVDPSDSMIANSSLVEPTGAVRRRRISSSSIHSYDP